MRFKAIKLTAGGSTLLEPVGHKEAVKCRLPLYFKGKRAAVIYDTIGSVEAPLYLAKPSRDELTGKELNSR